MQHPPRAAAPRFYLTARQRLSPGAILLACMAAILALSSVLYGLGRGGHVGLGSGSAGAARAASAVPAGGAAEDEKDDKDDPNQVDTIVLGDPADAPVPARRGYHVSPVHPTILVRLPRFGDDTGLIPDTAAGRLLYSWLAAFNQGSEPGLARVLGEDGHVAAQMELRQHTGGFTLLSAKELQPGLLVFRLRDQTHAAGEALGTLQMRPGTTIPGIASFSLRGVPGPGNGDAKGASSADVAGQG